jgi:hypothetical protein
VTLTIDFSQRVRQPCDRCKSLDATGGVRLEDNTGARRTFCRACTTKIITVCLTPTGNGEASD